MKILMIGPSITKAKGGMSSVILNLTKSSVLNKDNSIEAYPSYIDGNKLVSVFYGLFSLLRFYFTKRDYDIYHLHVASYGSTFRKRLYLKIIKKWNKKAVLHIHGGGFIDFYNHQSSNNQRKILDFLKKANAVVVLSNSWKQRFYDVFHLKDCIVIENGIDPNFYSLPNKDLNSSSKTLLSMGLLGKNKGTFDLIQAMKDVVVEDENIQLLLAGNGDVEEIKKKIQAYSLENNVKYVGWADDKVKLELLNKSGIFILPSYFEALPMSILEAMSCSNAIISSNVGSIPECIKKENGLLIEPGDIDALTQSILFLASHPETTKQMAVNNRHRIETCYNQNIQDKKLLKVYDGLF